MTRKGFADSVHTQTVKPGEHSSITLSLERLPAILAIASNVKGAVVTVDSLDVGESPVLLSRSPGKHHVIVKKSGYLPYEIDADLRPGERVGIEATLREEKRALTQKWWFWTAAGAVIAGAATSTYLLTRPDPERPAPNGGGLGWVVRTN